MKLTVTENLLKTLQEKLIETVLEEKSVNSVHVDSQARHQFTFKNFHW